MWTELALAFQHGNGYITAMVVIMFLGLVVLFERTIMLHFVYHTDLKKFLAQFKKLVAAEDMNKAMGFCRSASKVSVPHVALKALEAADTDPTTVKSTIEEESLDFLPKLEMRLQVLPALATAILFIGILGTIDSLWGAFHAIDVLDTAKKQSAIGQGIAGALNPTAFGVMTSLLLLLGQYFLRGSSVALTEQFHFGVAVLTNLLAPPEMMAYAPAAESYTAAAPTGSFDTPEPAPPPAAAAEAVATDEALDDIAVEEIKDEEEII